MHRVLASHLATFQGQYAPDLPTEKAFEAFVAYCVARHHTSDSFDPTDQIYEGDDPGIDSVLFVVDDVLVSSSEELMNLFETRRRDVDVHIIFTQAKTGESWSKRDINTFSIAVLDFVSEQPRYPLSDFMIERKAMFDAVIRNVGKVRQGKPLIACYYATSAQAPQDREICAAFSAFSDRLGDEGLFAEIREEPVDRERLIQLWIKSVGSIVATVRVFASAPFPKSPGIEESYVITASARDFVNKILTDENGNMKKSIFEENVRDFIGIDSEINSEIGLALEEPSTRRRFGILNNGITIVSPDVRLQSNEMFLADYQIVNGCQTSHVLFEYRELLTDDATVMAKIIETDDQKIIDEIVRSTNRQTRVDEHQFLATLAAVKRIEAYFNVRGADEEHRIFFERRPNQYSGQGIASVRIFDIRELARCVGAMFFDRPELATRYPNQLTSELRQVVFDEQNKEEIFYCAAYSYYRLRMHLGNNRIARKFSKIRWYLLMSIKYFIWGNDVPQPTSAKIAKVCGDISDFMSRNDPEALAVWERLCDLFEPVGELTRDRLKGSRFPAEVRGKVLQVR